MATLWRAATAASEAERVRCSEEQIQEWVEQACKIPHSLPSRSRLEQRLFVKDTKWDPSPGDVVGGLRLTVMRDGSMLWLCDEAISGEFSDDRVTEGGGGSKVAVERDGGELVETLSSVLRQNVALRAELGSAALSIPSLL